MIRVVVGIDFGTTYSGFSYANLLNKVVTTNDKWPEQEETDTNATEKWNIEYWDQMEKLKTNTVLKYSDDNKVECWGLPALIDPSIREDNLAQLFKLHLADSKDKQKLHLNLTDEDANKAKKAITDYIRKMGEQIKGTVMTRWPGINYKFEVLFVLAVPAEFPESSKTILRECAFEAGLINKLDSNKLQFTTEPEAAAIHVIDTISEIDSYIGKSFLVVDCGGGTVDLTIRQLLNRNELGEKTIRTGGFCGSINIDQEFIKFLEEKVGKSAVSDLKRNHYGKYQFLIHEFCSNVKLFFTGIEEDYKNYELDLKKTMKNYVTDSNTEDKWMIKLTFEDVKKMFDPVIHEIIKLIRAQLDADKSCSIMFLVGGFGESKYLQKRIREEFKDRVKNIIIPQQPIAAVARGAVKYGINKKFVKNRVLKYNYGRSTLRPYDESNDPPERERESGNVLVFKLLAKKGTTVDIDQKFSQISRPENSDQTAMWYQILITERDDVKYCDEDGVYQLGAVTTNLPDTKLGKDRKVHFELCFGEMEIRASAKNEYNGEEYETIFSYEYNASKCNNSAN